MSKDSKFIKRPLTETLEKVVWETSALDSGFATKYLLNYILDSAFLQICGALEQKVKCIYWELGSNNYELRYKILRDEIGECSNYEDKNKVFRKITEELIRKKQSINMNLKDKWESDIKLFFYNNFKKDIFKRNFSKEFEEFDNTDELKNFKNWNITKNNDDFLFNNEKLKRLKESDKDYILLLNTKGKIINLYDNIIKHRNSIAHNTKSVLNNLPDFEILRSDDYKYENPFLRIAIMLLVDRTFIEVYEQYETCLKNT